MWIDGKNYHVYLNFCKVHAEHSMRVKGIVFWMNRAFFRKIYSKICADYFTGWVLA
jgi:hypothetical protein